ncbi:MAG: hypothetical protein ACOH1T_10840 [Microbacteriaceae bacterium]
MIGLNQIAMDVDVVIANLKKFERPDRMPAENALLQTEGSSYGVAHVFNAQLKSTASVLEQVAQRVRENLENTRAAVKATMEDMVETDASLASVASEVNAQFDAVNTAAPVPLAVPEKHVNEGLK